MIDRLREIPLFKGTGDDQLESLARCLARRTFGRGVFIYHKDTPGRMLYIIESGRVRLFVISEMGQEISMDVLGPGDVFGTPAVLDGQLHITGAVSMETTVVLMLSRADLLHCLDACPPLPGNLIALLAGEARRSMRFIEDLAFLDVNGRVAARLLDLAARSGDEDGAEIPLYLTQGELASWVVATRESVNKVLGTMRARGLISIDGPRIIVLDPRRLRREVIY